MMFPFDVIAILAVVMLPEKQNTPVSRSSCFIVSGKHVSRMHRGYRKTYVKQRNFDH